jgi:hypothetical protein
VRSSEMKFSLCLIKHYGLKIDDGAGVNILPFLTSILDGGKQSALLSLGKSPAVPIG